MQHESADMGYTGTVESVRPEVIRDLLKLGGDAGDRPRFSLGEGTNLQSQCGSGGRGRFAAAVKAARVVFISNVAGVLVDGERIPRMTREQAEAYIADGVIYGGMIPKVETALNVLSSGLPQAVITDLHGWAQGGRHDICSLRRRPAECHERNHVSNRRSHSERSAIQRAGGGAARLRFDARRWRDAVRRRGKSLYGLGSRASP